MNFHKYYSVLCRSEHPISLSAVPYDQALNILVPLEFDRDAFTLELRSKGVMASVHYPEVLPETDMFNKYISSDNCFTASQDIANRIVTLPLFGAITQLQIKQIITALKDTTSAMKAKL